MTKQCELCKQAARMYCESDQASLCWECDAKVHGANFLVARHTRNLLCRSCQAPTPWRASGSRLGPTVSVCERCLGAGAEGGMCVSEKGEAAGGSGRIEAESGGVGDLGGDDDDDEEEERNEDGEVDEDDEDGENQVVPWSMEAEVATAATSPPVASCSSSEESSSGRTAICHGFLKRMRANVNPSTSQWQGDLARRCSPTQPGYLRPSPPPPAAAADVSTGRMLEEFEVGTSSSGGRLRHRKRAAVPPGRDHLPRGASGTVDFFLPSSPSSPI